MHITAPLFAAMALCCGTVMAFDSTVVTNEIHYAPAAGQSEFIALSNLHGVDEHMGYGKLSGGVDINFPAATIIPGHGYLIVAATPAAYPGALGPFTGQLDNGGETLRLRNVNDPIMDEAAYDDEGDWPIGADGSGATL